MNLIKVWDEVTEENLANPDEHLLAEFLILADGVAFCIYVNWYAVMQEATYLAQSETPEHSRLVVNEAVEEYRTMLNVGEALMRAEGWTLEFVRSLPPTKEPHIFMADFFVCGQYVGGQ